MKASLLLNHLSYNLKHGVRCLPSAITDKMFRTNIKTLKLYV